MSEIPESIIYVTQFKNQFDHWQVFHAFRNIDHAIKDVGKSGVILKTIEYSAYEQLQKQNKELVETLKKLFDVVNRYGVQEYSECLASDYTDYTVDALDMELENSQKVLAKYQKGDLK